VGALEDVYETRKRKVHSIEARMGNGKSVKKGSPISTNWY
jgi:hypothetical protein